MTFKRYTDNEISTRRLFITLAAKKKSICKETLNGRICLLPLKIFAIFDDSSGFLFLPLEVDVACKKGFSTNLDTSSFKMNMMVRIPSLVA